MFLHLSPSWLLQLKAIQSKLESIYAGLQRKYIKLQNDMELYSELFVFADQPATCPSCGARSEIIFDMQHTRDVTQVYKCLSEICQKEFVIVQDDDINNDFLCNRVSDYGQEMS